MSNDSLPIRPLRLVLIDGDPIFRLGLKTACERLTDWQVVAEAATAGEAVQVLAAWAREGGESGEVKAVDVAIAALEGLTAGDRPSNEAETTTVLAFCQQLRTLFPNLPILLLGRASASELAMLRQAGVNGHCPKGTEISRLVDAIRLVARGEWVWEVVEAEGGQETGRMLNSSPTLGDRLASPVAQLCHSGVRQIDATLAQVTAELQQAKILQGENIGSLLDWVFLSGRRRELLAARWIVSRMLPATPRPEPQKPRPLTREIQATGVRPPSVPERLAVPNQGTVTKAQFPIPHSPFNLQSALFDATTAKLQSGLVNLSGVPLEIDILRQGKKQELIYIILRKLEALLDELRFSQVQLDQLSEKRPTLIRDLWEAAIADFFGKYYTLRADSAQSAEFPQPPSARGTAAENNGSFMLPPSTLLLSGNGVEVVPVLLRDVEIVQQAILDKIPLVVDFLAHLLFQTPLKINHHSCPVGSPEAMQRAEALLQNLVLQVANGVIQPLLNNFADIAEIKENFYDGTLLSTREIEKFRNNLSWKYRLERYIWEPKAIFESHFWLLVLHEQGIQRTTIYEPRNQELAQLSGVQLAVTLVLETRDALSPRLRAVVSFMGTGVVYVLTQVIGRGLGLIGRGILQGIGHSLQDSRWEKKGDRQP